ncbi:MAG: hypothetical protein RLZZ422_694 [Pseudomonadota bacterium]|jgi:hypothetical protein
MIGQYFGLALERTCLSIGNFLELELKRKIIVQVFENLINSCHTFTPLFIASRMIMTKQYNVPLKARLNLETARISWPEIERFFARGRVLHIASTLDLLEVAEALVEDNMTKFTDWTSTGLVKHLEDLTAKSWVADDSRLWAVVIAPWVLVQERL